jgi:hypothetical protein
MFSAQDQQKDRGSQVTVKLLGNQKLEKVHLIIATKSEKAEPLPRPGRTWLPAGVKSKGTHE